MPYFQREKIQMKKVIYLGYYETQDNPRSCSPAAVTMMDYVSSSIRKSGYSLEIISPAQSEEVLPEVTEITDGYEIVFSPSFGLKKEILKKVVYKIRRESELLRILFEHVGTDDIVVVYHSLAYIGVLRKLRQRKKFKLILQVNEIYADVLGKSTARKKEIKWINEADAYLLSTEKLVDVIEHPKKKFAICPGTFQIEPIREIYKEKQKMKDRINVVYAGTFDMRKGGTCGRYSKVSKL